MIAAQAPLGELVDATLQAVRHVHAASFPDIVLHRVEEGRRCRALVKYGDWWCARRGSTYEEAVHRLGVAIENREGFGGIEVEG